MNNLKNTLCIIFGFLGATIAELYGGWSEDMITLIIVMSIDFAMGLVIAGIYHKSPKSDSGKISSKSCFMGLCKKCTILLFVLIAHRLDISLGTDYIKTATIIGFIANELISIIENADIIGVPLPKIIKKAVELLKNKDGENND